MLALIAGLIGIGPIPASRLAAQQSAGTTVTGMVRVSAPPEREPTMLSPYARRRYSPPTGATAAVSSPENAVVYLLSDRPLPGTPRPATIYQANRTISPHVTVVRRGARIDFPNDDEVFHNLFSLSDTKSFNLGRYAPGQSRSVTFDRTGIVRMFCDIHSEMTGTIVVVDTPFFARPDAAGNFRIGGVPPGRYRLVAWHSTGGTATREVTVGPSPLRVDLELTGQGT